MPFGLLVNATRTRVALPRGTRSGVHYRRGYGCELFNDTAVRQEQGLPRIVAGLGRAVAVSACQGGPSHLPRPAKKIEHEAAHSPALCFAATSRDTHQSRACWHATPRTARVQSCPCPWPSTAFGPAAPAVATCAWRHALQPRPHRNHFHLRFP